jgi:hypothetical protein
MADLPIAGELCTNGTRPLMIHLIMYFRAWRGVHVYALRPVLIGYFLWFVSG